MSFFPTERGNRKGISRLPDYNVLSGKLKRWRNDESQVRDLVKMDNVPRLQGHVCMNERLPQPSLLASLL